MKKKKWWLIPSVVVLASLLVTTTMADRPIKLVVNGTQQKLSAQPVIVNNHVLVPARDVAEALGAKVTWDDNTSTVVVQADANKSSDMQLQQLERAVAPQTPQEAAEQWARGVQTRNAALQYAVMTPDLQAKNYDSFAAMNWVTGVSSPWVQQSKVIKTTQVNDTEWKIQVSFESMTSTGIAGINTTQVTVDKINANWYVSDLTTLDSYDSLLQQSATLPDGTAVREGMTTYNSFDLLALRVFSAPTGGQPGEEVQVPLNFYHCGKVVQQETVNLPFGPATLSLVQKDASTPATTPDMSYYLTVTRDYPNRDDLKLVYTLVGHFTGEQTAAKQDFLKIAQTWHLPQ